MRPILKPPTPSHSTLQRIAATLLLPLTPFLPFTTTRAQDSPEPQKQTDKPTTSSSPSRDLSQFAFLLTRSPFSLPTAEEKSSLADRFSITGAASWDGKQRIFVVDKTTQQRFIVTQEPNHLNMSLIEFLPDSDPRRMRARIQVGSDVATIEFAELPNNAPVAQSEMFPNPVLQGIPPGIPSPQISNGAPQPGQPVRRIIRRRMISGNPQTPQ